MEAIDRPKASIIVTTVGRPTELDRLFASLVQQTYRSFEVILVDQSGDERVRNILQIYQKDFEITGLSTTSIGGSHARNLGSQWATGETICFPDDDCWYPHGLLEQVTNFFTEHTVYAGVTGRAVDEIGRPAVGRWDARAGEINRWNEWTRSSEFTIFMRRHVFIEIGGFDTRIGPGASTPWQANEGDDLILRGLRSGYRFFYQPSLEIFHPSPQPRYGSSTVTRGRKYGRGMGYVLRRHRYPLWFFLYWCARPACGSLLFAARRDPARAKYYWASLVGRLEGWLGAFQ